MDAKLIGVGRTADIYEWEGGRALKLFQEWMPRRDIELEVFKTRCAAAAGVKAPKVYELVEVDGRVGLVMQKLSGKSMLYWIKQAPEQAEPLVKMFAEVHRRIHAAEVRELPDQRVVIRWTVEHAPVLTDAQKAAVLARLDTLPCGDALCHGDYHPDNLLIEGDSVYVLDWTAAVRGNPLADVARTLMILSIGRPPDADTATNKLIEQARRVMLDTYLNVYFARQPIAARAEMERWMPVMAAARLWEDIEGEADRLIGMIEQGLASAS